MGAKPVDRRADGVHVVVVDRNGHVVGDCDSDGAPPFGFDGRHFEAAERGENPIFRCQTPRGIRWVSLTQVPEGFRASFVPNEDDGSTGCATALADSEDALSRESRDLMELTYAASHHLNEPIRTLQGFVELFRQKYAGTLDAEGEEYLHFIERANGRMNHLVRDLVEYARIGRHSTVSDVDCLELVDGVLSSLGAELVASGALVQLDSMPRIQGHRTELEMLFKHLVANALKYRRPNTRAHVRIGCTERDDAWEFWVRDNGMGIEPDHVDRVFSMFKRLHSRKSYSGTGIGLAHCRKVADLHRGRIWVEQNAPHGSTFRFTLSRSLVDAEAAVDSSRR